MTRCSYCYKRGHNKRTCPDRRKRAAENPDGYVAKQLANEKAQAKTRRPRLCSYCHEAGHNKRTCPVAKKRLVQRIKKNKFFRRDFAELLETIGLGPGALVHMIPTGDSQACIEDYEYMKKTNPGSTLAIVQAELRESNISCDLGQRYNQAVIACKTAAGKSVFIALPKCPAVDAFWAEHSGNDNRSRYDRVDWEIASPSDSRFTFSEAWRSGVLGSSGQVGL